MALIDQLIAYYPFRDDLKDHSGNNYHISQDQADEYLAQGNFRPLPTIAGGGIFGDGTLQMTSTSAALFPENVLPALRGDGSTPDGFTVSFWARIDPSVATGTGQHTVLFSSLGEAVDSSKFYRNFLIHFPWGNNNGYFDCGAYRYDNGNIIDGEAPNWVDKRFEGAVTIPGNEWHHWVFTKDDSNGGIRAVYRDGVLQAAWTGAPNEVGYDNVYMRHSYKNSFYLGSHDFRGWPGQLNELMFHSRALTPQEAVDLYNGGSGQALPVDSDLPTVTVEGDRVIFVEQGLGFTVPAATAVDSLGASIAVSVNNPVDISTINTYDLVFSATDSNNKTATATITVEVRAASLNNGLVAKYDMSPDLTLSDNFPGNQVDESRYTAHRDVSQANNAVTIGTESAISGGNFSWPRGELRLTNSVSGDFVCEIDFDITNMPHPNFNQGQNYAQIGIYDGGDSVHVRVRKLKGVSQVEALSYAYVGGQGGHVVPGNYPNIQQGTFHLSRVGSTIYGKVKNTAGGVVFSFDRSWTQDACFLRIQTQAGNFTDVSQANQAAVAVFSNLSIEPTVSISNATTIFRGSYSAASESGALLVEQDGLTYLDLENNNGYLSSGGTYSEFDSFTVSFSMFRSTNQDSSIVSTNGDQAKAISALLNDNTPGATGKMNFWVTGDANAAGEAYLDLPPDTLNKWVDIAWVRDFALQEYRLYKDGVLEETIPMTNMVPTSFNDFQIGAWKNNSGVQERFFSGQLNNFAIWDRALSGTEVQAFIDSGDSLDTTAPVITVLGSSPVTVNVGATYTDAGATAVDAVDGAVSVVTTGADAISVSADASWNDVSLLLPFDGDATDSSPNNNNATLNGNVSHSTAQQKFGTHSVYLNSSSGAKISIPSSADFAFGTGDFTIEFWVRWNNPSSTFTYPTFFDFGSFQNAFSMRRQGPNNIVFVGPGHSHLGNIPFTPQANRWYHLAASRASGSLRIFIDGTQVQQVSFTSNLQSNTSVILGGSVHEGNEGLQDAYLDDFRITKGVARYTSSFEVPTEAHATAATGGAQLKPADANFSDVTLLLPLDSNLTDASTSGHTVTATGNTWQTDAPALGSGNIHLTTSGVMIVSAPNFNIGFEEFTMEYFVKGDYDPEGGYPHNGFMESSGFGRISYSAGPAWDGIAGHRMLMVEMGGATIFAKTGVGAGDGSGGPDSAWEHTAIVRYFVNGVDATGGMKMKLFINGVENIDNSYATGNTTIGNVAANSSISSSNNLHFGEYTHRSDQKWKGAIDAIRITKGVARYTANFAVPTAAYPLATTMQDPSAYTVTYTATDTSGNVGTATRIVNVGEVATEQSTYAVAGILAADKHMVFLEGKLLSSNQYTIADDSLEITDASAIGFAIGSKIQIVKVK